ncbi:MAG: hypothetical protein LBQ12_07225 [Deltaproteobacteria bacterium]|jgi:hypothetical protein|nr:hypothetical protein [Deltaproteobacteria bacterium]
MKPSAPLSALAPALAAALALSASPLFGQDGWPVFDSSEVQPPGQGLSFTARYPPAFTRSPQAPVPDAAPAAGQAGGEELSEADRGRPPAPLQFFFGEIPGTGKRVTMQAVLGRLRPDDKELMEYFGPEDYWEAMGQEMGRGLGSFRGAKPFEFRGRRAADLNYDWSRKDEDGGERTYLSVRRSVMAGDALISLVCTLRAPSSDVRAEGLRPGEGPDFSRYCTPFLESLALDEKGSRPGVRQ